MFHVFQFLTFLVRPLKNQILTSKPSIKREIKGEKKGISHGLEVPNCFLPEGEGILVFDLFTFLFFDVKLTLFFDKNSQSILCDFSKLL